MVHIAVNGSEVRATCGTYRKKRVKPVSSGGYSKLAARGKDFPNCMFSKKKYMALISYFPFFSQNHSDLKKSVHFDLISVFAIFLPKSR